MAQKEEKAEVIRKVLLIEPVKYKNAYKYKKTMMFYDEAVMKFLKKTPK